MGVVKLAWSSTPATSNDYLTPQNKLRATAVSLRRWSDRWIGDVNLQIAIALEVIKQLEYLIPLWRVELCRILRGSCGNA